LVPHPLPSPFDIIHRRIYTSNRCFYCGKRLRSERSREHVFPEWLQTKFGLAYQSLTLLNGTTIPYRSLKVPCCKTCNNVHLSQLENRVKRLLFERPVQETSRHLDQIFIWATKILLSIVYAERLLPLNRRYPKGKRILPRELRESFQMRHFFIQSLIIPMRFTYDDERRIPGSVFLFGLKTHDDPGVLYDFRDDLLTLSVFMRLGNRGIIAVADGGAIDMAIGDVVRRDAKRQLHPIQFAEIGARIFYKARLFNRTPTYIMMKHDDDFNVMQMPLAGLSARPVFNEWKHPAYAEILASFTGYPIETLAPGDRTKVMEWLTDEDGEPLDIPIKD
jgi:hypothetical protein